MTKKEIRQKYCNKRNYTSWNKYNVTEYSKWLENELIKGQKKVKKLTIPVVVKSFVRFNGLKTKCFDPSKKYKVLDDKDEHYLIADDENDVIWVFKQNFTLVIK